MSTTFLWRPCLVQAAARTQDLTISDIYSLRVIEQCYPQKDVHGQQLQFMVQVVDLKDQLKQRGLKTSGLKPELQMRLMGSLQHDAEAPHALPGGTGSNGTAFSATSFGNGKAGLHTSTQHSAPATQAQTAPAVKKPKLSKGKTITKKVGSLPCAAACWWHRHVMKPDSIQCSDSNEPARSLS